MFLVWRVIQAKLKAQISIKTYPSERSRMYLLLSVLHEDELYTTCTIQVFSPLIDLGLFLLDEVFKTFIIFFRFINIFLM